MTHHADVSRGPLPARRRTAAEAGEPPEPHHVWDEDTQSWVPRGMALVHDAMARPMDLEAHLDDWKRNQDVMLRFVREYLIEAEYDTKGNLVPGKVGDYYKVPGTVTKALTKRGGEKMAKLHRYAKGATKLIASTETADYTSATVEVTLLDQYRRPVGSAVSSCSTAEAGFRSAMARKKYGAQGGWQERQWVESGPPDYRAAINDVVARAGKRAFVQAVIVACALDEIFTAAEDGQEAPAPAAPKSARSDLPTHTPFKNKATEAYTDMTDDQLAKIAAWYREKGKFLDHLEAVEAQQELRREHDAEGPGA